MDRNLAQASKFKKIFLYSLLGLLASLVLILLLGEIPTLLLYGSGVAAVMSLVAWIAALIANQAALKGRSWASFFMLSIFFPFIMWIVVSVMTTDQSQPISGTKKCPKCAEYVKAEATLCKHCGSAIRPQK
jgi:O-antigen/teichoic acid export membrane protein